MSAKNHHYVPKFHLKYFSFMNNKKEIGVFNVKNLIFKNRVPLKSQASKKYFYGNTEILENLLSKIEGEIAFITNSIVEKEIIETNRRKYFFTLVTFLLLTDLRNPNTIENIDLLSKNVSDKFKIHNEFKNERVKHNENLKIAFGSISTFMISLSDLEFKLLINNTKTPFVLSDNPVVKYNQYLENKKLPFPATGYNTKGLQLFIPLSPKLTLVFYDKEIYELESSSSITIDNENDIQQLNILQFVNTSSSIFFNDNVDEQYIHTIHNLSLQFLKAKKIEILEFKNFNSKEILAQKLTDSKINLDLSFVKINSKVNLQDIDIRTLPSRSKK